MELESHLVIHVASHLPHGLTSRKEQTCYLEGASVMQGVKSYLFRNFEQLFVLIILVSVVVFNYLMPYKLIFLNFYFIPIMLAAYYLGVRSAVLGSVLCTLMVSVYVYLSPIPFMPPFTQLDLWMNIVTWASFLILTAAVVAKLASRLTEEVEHGRELNRDLEENKAKLEAADKKLRDHAEKLEKNVADLKERVEKLLRARQST